MLLDMQLAKIDCKSLTLTSRLWVTALYGVVCITILIILIKFTVLGCLQWSTFTFTFMTSALDAPKQAKRRISQLRYRLKRGSRSSRGERPEFSARLLDSIAAYPGRDLKTCHTTQANEITTCSVKIPPV